MPKPTMERKIEITPEMAQAGVDAWLEWCEGSEAEPRALAVEMYAAMEAARLKAEKR